MADTQVVSRQGLGLSSVLFIVFLVLKLTDNVDWSWFWVFSPLWISAGLAVGLVLGVILVGLAGL